MTPQEAIEELQRRGITVSSESVLEPKGTTFEEFKKFGESLLKGSAKGIVDIVGGWGNLYDYLKKSGDPSALSGTGIARGIKNLTGVDVMSIPGYRGAYEVGAAGAPAAALTAAGLPGLFSRTAPGVAGEFAVAGGTGMLASSVAPDSPLAQIAIQSSPYAAKGALQAGRAAYNRPTGEIPPNAAELLSVGRMTPGELTGNRPQLAREAVMEASPKIEERGNVFRQAQAQDIGSFLDNVFSRAASKAGTPQEAATAAFDAFANYGKSLTSRLRSDASKDFSKAKRAGGLVETQPVYDAVAEQLAKLPPEQPGNAALRASLQKILDEYVIPGTPASVTPSTILGPTGQPATVNVTPAVPASLKSIDIERLQKNLSAWGEAAYSGKADFGNGNIFEGVAPGQAKGAALNVLRGFKTALDNAIESGVAGAEDLKKARDNFAKNLDRISEFADRPLTRYFDKERVTELTPEDVVNKLSSSKPSERLFLAQVLQNSPQGAMVFDTVRMNEFQKLLERVQKSGAGAAEGQPAFDLKTVLKELNNRKGDFNFLFPDAKDAADVALAMQWLQKVQKTAVEKQGGIANDAYAATRGLGGTSQQGLLLREITSLVQSVLENPKALADTVFNPETISKMAKAQRQGKLGNLKDISKDLSGSLAKFAPRVGPMAETAPPVDESAPATPTAEPTMEVSPEEALRRLQEMGIPIQ